MRAFARVDILKMDPPEGTRLCLFSEDVISSWGTRTSDGRRITAEWGEPTPDGLYTPIFTVIDDGKIVVDRAEYEALLKGKEQVDGGTSVAGTPS